MNSTCLNVNGILRTTTKSMRQTRAGRLLQQASLQAKCFGGAAAVLGACGLLAIASNSCAQEFHSWTSQTGGDFSNARSWNPSRVPGAGDAAVFELDAEYEVVLPNETTHLAGILAFDGASTFNRSRESRGTYELIVSDLLNVAGSTMLIESGEVIAERLIVENNGVLNVPERGGGLTANSAIVRSGGKLLVQGKTQGSSAARFLVNRDLTIDGGAIELGNTAAFKFAGQGLTIKNGGSLTGLNLGFRSADSIITVDGANSSLATNSLSIGSDSEEIVTLNVQNGSNVTGSTTVRRSGRLNVTSGGTVRPDGALFVSGSLNIGEAASPGNVSTAKPLRIDGGTVTLTEGRLSAPEVSVSNGGTLDLLGGSFEFSRFFGDLFNLGATVSIDVKRESDGVTGNYTQLVDSTLAIDIGGVIPGQFDQMRIVGNASVGGTLDVKLADGFLPVVGNRFPITETIVGNVAGEFDSLDLPVFNGLTFDVIYEPQAIMLEVIDATTGLLGDFNTDDVLDGLDIDLLSAAVGGSNTSFDLTLDGVVDQEDRDFWVEEISNTYYGDANLDGEFNTGDFVQVFQRGHFEDERVGNSGWADGDWTGDGKFDTSDFVLAFQSGGFELGPRTAKLASAQTATAVPEPASIVPFLIGLTGLIRNRIRSRK